VTHKQTRDGGKSWKVSERKSEKKGENRRQSKWHQASQKAGKSSSGIKKNGSIISSNET